MKFEIKSWFLRTKKQLFRLAFFVQYYTRKLLFQIKKRAPHLKKLHLQSFPAIHVRKMDWMDFILKFSSELLIVVLTFGVAGLNLFFFSTGEFRDKSLAQNFLNMHPENNPKLYSKNNSIVTVVSNGGFVHQAQAEDFSGLGSEGFESSSDDGSQLVMSDEEMILAPNPDSVRLNLENQIKYYTVKSGDTMQKIANTFGISQQTLIWNNGLTTGYANVGQELKILPVDGILVTATANDTLPDIAARYNPEKNNSDKKIKQAGADKLLETIVAYNGLTDAEDIDGGQMIIVPGGVILAEPIPAPTPRPTTPKPSTTAQSPAAIPDVTSVGSGYDGEGHIFPRGYCTWYVASQMKITFGGNAKNWLVNAKASGYVTGQEPAVRSAVVMTGNASRSMRLYGHVAYVEAVEGDKIFISEMNYEGFNVKSSRWVSINSPSIRGYIYP